MKEVIYYIPKKKITKQARLNLYHLLKSEKVFKDKEKVSFYIDYLNNKKHKEQKRWIGLSPSKKMLKYLYWLIFKYDFKVETYKQILNKYYGSEEVKDVF